MMSISTTSTSGVSCRIWIASRPVSAERICILYRSSTLVRAKILRMSSSTISTRRPLSTASSSCSFSSICRCGSSRFATGRWSSKLISSSSRSGDCTCRIDRRSCEAIGHRFVEQHRLVGIHHQRNVARASPACQLARSADRRAPAGVWRSHTMQSKRRSSSSRSASSSSSATDGAHVAIADQRQHLLAPLVDRARSPADSFTGRSTNARISREQLVDCFFGLNRLEHRADRAHRVAPARILLPSKRHRPECAACPNPA